MCVLCRTSRFPDSPYHGGSRPDLADISAFGIYRALMPFNIGQMIDNKDNSGEKWVKWYHNMQNSIKSYEKLGASK